MDAESGNLQSGARMVVGDKSKEKCSICGSPGHTHLHCYGTPVQRTSNPSASWYIVLYEWQGAHDLSNYRDWHTSAEIMLREESARCVIDSYTKNKEPRPGKLRYRNVRGPFPWSPDEDHAFAGVPGTAEEILTALDKKSPDETTVGNERTLALEALALDVLATEQECANKQRFPNGCGECIYCQAAALMLNRPAVEPARELSPSEAASFAKTLARSPRRISYNSNAVQRTAPRRTREGWFRFSDGWHPVQPFLLEPGEDEAQAVQNCFPGQRVEFRGRKPPRG